MGLVHIHDVGDLLTVSQASTLDSITAGGTGDNTAVTGTAVDRLDPATGALAGSAKFSILWSAALTATFTLSLKAVSIDHSPDGSTWTTGFASFTDPGVVATGPTGGGTVTGVTSFNVDLTGAYRYVRLHYTPDMSETATDTATLWAAAIKGGYDRLPA
jgi:hypothetical protein